jgi:hypothetical protein
VNAGLTICLLQLSLPARTIYFYVTALQVVINGFYAREGKTCLRADSNLYSGKEKGEREREGGRGGD